MSSLQTTPSPAPFPHRSPTCSGCRAPLAWTATERRDPARRSVGFLDEDDRTYVLCDRCARTAGLTDSDAA